MSHPRAARSRPALTLIAAGIVALLVAIGVLQAQALRASSSAEVARALEQGLGLRARVGRTQLDPGGLELRAYDVALDGKHGAVLRARELRVRPSLGALLRGSVALRSLELHGAVLTVHEGDLPQSALAPGRGWPFVSFSARGAQLTWQTRELGSVELARADLQLHASGKTL